MRALGLLFGLTLLLGGAPALTGCDSGSDTVCSGNTDQFATEDLTPEGTALGASLEIGDCVSVDYVGRLADGSGTFDEGDLNFFYSTNAGLIPGFILGMSGQQVGETRLVTIPPTLGYGERDLGGRGEPYVGIPACSTLQFEITVTAINQDTRVCTGG